MTRGLLKLYQQGSGGTILSSVCQKIFQCHNGFYPASSPSTRASTFEFESARMYVQKYRVGSTVMLQACANVILGQKFFNGHEAVVFELGESRICCLFILQDQKSIGFNCSKSAGVAFIGIYVTQLQGHTPSRLYSSEDQTFFNREVKRLLASGIIEPSESPWQSQVLVVRNSTKLRFVIDYSQTVNRCTLLDTYPLPKIDKIVN